MKKIYFTVTNDLTYDQRMHRICNSLAAAGYGVVLVGRNLRHSLPLSAERYGQKRLRCFFNKGFLFYAEYNLRLLAYLFAQKPDAVCAVDLDTILPCLLVSKVKSVPRIYDAHEYFTEMKEVRTRPLVKRFWTAVERFAVPKFQHGYTVSQGLADAFAETYNRRYGVIRNLPVLQPLRTAPREKFILYGGAVNEGRGFEVLIPAMKEINCKLVICGDGNFMDKLIALIKVHGVEHKVELKGMTLPADLRAVMGKAWLGVGLAEREGLNQWQALPNKFLDYMHAGLPQVAVNFPEYRKINNEYEVAVLMDLLSPKAVAATVNDCLKDESSWVRLHRNSLKAREVFCWQREENILLRFYQSIFR